MVGGAGVGRAVTVSNPSAQFRSDEQRVSAGVYGPSVQVYFLSRSTSSSGLLPVQVCFFFRSTSSSGDLLPMADFLPDPRPVLTS